MAECSTSDLIAQACISQFACLDEKMQRAVMLQLLCNISAGGSGGTNNQSGVVSPIGTATPDYVGQGYTLTVSPFGYWTSIGLTNNDWLPVI